MLLALIHPPPTISPSGGDIFNDQIIQQAKRYAYSINSITQIAVSREQIIRLKNRYDLLIWDSIFFHDLAKFTIELKSSQSCLLCHYLPSLNPLLSDKQRFRWQSVENEVLVSMRFIIVTGQLIKDEIEQRFPEKRVEICEPGIDAVFLQNSTKLNTVDSTIQLLTVANILPEKGYLDVLLSLADINNISWVWHICGSDSVNVRFTDQFWETAKESGIDTNINYHGILTQRQLANLMKHTDIFVMASYYESYGMALAEAATMRMPIISTRVGAANKIVQHGINGFLLAIGDLTGLQNSLQSLINSALMRQKFSSNQHYQNPSWALCCKTLISICNHAKANIDD